VRTVAQTEMVASKTKMIAIGTEVLTGITKENGIVVITGIETRRKTGINDKDCDRDSKKEHDNTATRSQMSSRAIIETIHFME
jgi:hypothetical protein